MHPACSMAQSSVLSSDEHCSVQAGIEVGSGVADSVDATCLLDQPTRANSMVDRARAQSQGAQLITVYLATLKLPDPRDRGLDPQSLFA